MESIPGGICLLSLPLPSLLGLGNWLFEQHIPLDWSPARLKAGRGGGQVGVVKAVRKDRA